MTDHVEQMRTNEQDFDSKVESIRNHPDLSGQAKQRYLQETYGEATEFHGEHAAVEADEWEVTFEEIFAHLERHLEADLFAKVLRALAPEGRGDRS